MATTAIDELSGSRRAHDDGTEVEIDDAGCCLRRRPQHFAVEATEWPGGGA